MLATGMPPASLQAAGSGPSTATSAPFMSSAMGSAQLPSTAGWASNHHGRSSSRSPRRSASVSMDDPSRSRPRIQIRRREHNAPPGFEESSIASPSAAPSRPPGFDAPGAANTPSRGLGRGEVVRSVTLPTMPSVSAPPGFGPGPVMPKDGHAVESSATDVAAAWSQEASADKVFSTNDRRARRPVGIPLKRPDVSGDMDSRAELAQVLAKIGGDLGVSSEFQDVKNIPTPYSVPMEQAPRRTPGSVDQNVYHPSLGSLFAAQPYHGGYAPQTSTNSSHRDQHVPAQPSYAYGPTASALPVAFGPGTAAHVTSRPEMPPSRRNTSRFRFARNDVPERLSHVAPIPIPRTLLSPPVSLEMKVSPRVVSKPEPIPGSNGMRTESHILGELTRGTPSLNSTATSTPQHARQSRSRFDFVDHESSPPKTQLLSRSGLDTLPQPTVSTDTQPENDGVSAPLANLSTAEKLASIFRSAEWSEDGDGVSPTPAIKNQVEEAAGQRPEHSQKQIVQAVGSASTHARISSVDVSEGIDDRTRPPEPPQSHTLQFSPPGFREATPGISPETTAVEQTSATTGVATCVESGGVGVGVTENTTSGQTEESQSSEAESLEEDRKRSRAQRKRDKKARQLREAAEKKASESRSNRVAAVVSDDAEIASKPKQQHAVKTSPGLREIMNPPQVHISTKHPKELSKQSKSTRAADDPARFMSVSELEKEVEAARAREAQLQDRLLELQRRIRSYDNVRT